MSNLDQLKQMSDDEVKALNNQLAKKLVRKFAVRAAVVTGVAVAVAVAVKHLSESDEEND